MKMLNLFGKSVVSMAVVLSVCGANAAQNGRDGAQNAQSGRSGMMSARMPTIPTVGITTVGNPAVTVISQPAEVNNIPNPMPIPTPIPEPQPTPTGCDDGGVRNSEYTIQMCMDDVLQCINNGGLQGGLNDLYCNEDVRNAVMNGMMLCQSAVDKCIREVRVDCRNIYAQSSDVWLDFNSRVIQPEYYNFVLRKTGLTPNQAENTCLLLDRNTYGSSFAAVSDANAVNTEYANRVGAYNGAEGGSLSKANPQGVAVNTVGYDGNRGHYARWDACNADCLIRVAAYNKDDLITNSWLFGALGNDEPAEVWQKAGSSFVCNKDLFDMSLMNDTKTAAVVGIGGGTLLGAGIGAGVGAHNYNKKAEKAYADPCSDAEYRKKLGAYIAQNNQQSRINSYLKEVSVSDSGTTVEVNSDDPISDFYNLSELQCKNIHNLYARAELYKDAISKCKELKNYDAFMQSAGTKVLSKIEYKNALGSVSCTVEADCEGEKSKFAEECLFVPLQTGLAQAQKGIFCGAQNKCLPLGLIEPELSRMNNILYVIKPVIDSSVVDKKAPSKGAEIAKGALIGGATGAGVGGIVTGITALVERNNISCHVGDGLNTVALGKSHTIDSLKDFYVKWNLHLPDAVSPTSAVSDRASWEQACRQFNNRLHDCPNVQINLVHGNTYDLVQSACVVSGSICIVNEAAAQSHGIQ